MGDTLQAAIIDHTSAVPKLQRAIVKYGEPSLAAPGQLETSRSSLDVLAERPPIVASKKQSWWRTASSAADWAAGEKHSLYVALMEVP
jgi:hypothetical protein